MQGAGEFPERSDSAASIRSRKGKSPETLFEQLGEASDSFQRHGQNLPKQGNQSSRTIFCKPSHDKEDEWRFLPVQYPRIKSLLPFTIALSSLSPDENALLKSIEYHSNRWAMISFSDANKITAIKRVEPGEDALNLQATNFIQQFKNDHGFKLLSNNIRKARMKYLFFSLDVPDTRNFLFDSLIVDPDCHRSELRFGGPGSGKSTVCANLYADIEQDPHVLIVDSAMGIEDPIGKVSDKPSMLRLFSCSMKDVTERILEREERERNNALDGKNPADLIEYYDADYIAKRHVNDKIVFEGHFRNRKTTKENASFNVVENPKTPSQYDRFDAGALGFHTNISEVEDYFAKNPSQPNEKNEQYEKNKKAICEAAREFYAVRLEQGQPLDPWLIKKMTGEYPSIPEPQPLGPAPTQRDHTPTPQPEFTAPLLPHIPSPYPAPEPEQGDARTGAQAHGEGSPASSGHVRQRLGRLPVIKQGKFGVKWVTKAFSKRDGREGARGR